MFASEIVSSFVLFIDRPASSTVTKFYKMVINDLAENQGVFTLT